MNSFSADEITTKITIMIKVLCELQIKLTLINIEMLVLPGCNWEQCSCKLV